MNWLDFIWGYFWDWLMKYKWPSRIWLTIIIGGSFTYTIYRLIIWA